MASFHFSALIFAVTALSPLAANAACSAAQLSDTVCDCGCGAVDPACTGSDFTMCAVSHCPAGQVPWEHSPESCMTSACGDGWKDAAAGEACDDFNALASGGCSADCHTVTAGYVCGEGATGCHLAPVDAGQPMMDAGVGAGTDAGQPPTDAGSNEGTDAGTGATMPTGGCSTVPGSLLALAALLGLRRRAR